MIRITAVQMDNLRDLLGIRRRDRVLNVWVRELCRVAKRVDARIDENLLRWISHNKRMENDMIAKRVQSEQVNSFREQLSEEKRLACSANKEDAV